MLRALTIPSPEAISIDEVKLRLRIDGDSMDTMLPGCITAAREIVERQTGYALAAVDYEWTPIGARISPLPICPGVVTSAAAEYPILFTTSPGPVPEALKSAVVLLVGDMIANTEAGTEKLLHENPAVQNLIFPFRRVLP